MEILEYACMASKRESKVYLGSIDAYILILAINQSTLINCMMTCR